MSISFLIVSKESWSDKRWARKQWLPYFLAQHPLVDRVVYVNRPRAWWRREVSDVAGGRGKLQLRQAALMFPGERWAWVRRFNRAHIARQLLMEMAPEHRWVVLFYHPWDAVMISCLKKRGKLVFDWTEDWADFHALLSMHGAQQQAVCEADAVLTVTEELHRLAAHWRGSSQGIFFLPNATALQPTKGMLPAPEVLRNIPRPRIGFIGHAGPWFDHTLVEELVRRMPEWQWVLVGGVREIVRSRLGRYSSVHMLGVRKPQELLALMQSCDVLVAPYHEQFSGDATKLYDYLVAGRPIVSSPCETAARLQPCVRVAHGAQEWEQSIVGLLATSGQTKDCFQPAIQHHWKHRAETLVDYLTGESEEESLQK